MNKKVAIGAGVIVAGVLIGLGVRAALAADAPAPPLPDEIPPPPPTPSQPPREDSGGRSTPTANPEVLRAQKALNRLRTKLMNRQRWAGDSTPLDPFTQQFLTGGCRSTGGALAEDGVMGACTQAATRLMGAVLASAQILPDTDTVTADDLEEAAERVEGDNAAATAFWRAFGNAIGGYS